MMLHVSDDLFSNKFVPRRFDGWLTSRRSSPTNCTTMASDPAQSHICISCNRGFKTIGNLGSHQTQAASCHWVVKEREKILATEQADWRELSDQEDDPPGGDFDMEMATGGFDAIADEILDSEDVDEQECGTTTGGTPDHWATAEDEEDSDLHCPESRQRVEEDLDTEEVLYIEYEGAGKAFRRDGSTHQAFSTAQPNSANTIKFHPFTSQMDYNIARWIKEEAISQAAFDRFLEIEGVSLFLAQMSECRTSQKRP